MRAKGVVREGCKRACKNGKRRVVITGSDGDFAEVMDPRGDILGGIYGVQGSNSLGKKRGGSLDQQQNKRKNEDPSAVKSIIPEEML